MGKPKPPGGKTPKRVIGRRGVGRNRKAPRPKSANDFSDPDPPPEEQLSPFQKLRHEVETEIWRRVKKYIPLIIIVILLILLVVACKLALGITFSKELLSLLFDHLFLKLILKA